MPYAGITLNIVLLTPSFIDIVKKVEEWSRSAGNIFELIKYGTSETLCNEIVVNEKLKFISEHVPKHRRPLNDNQFGHYLAGLIDGDGHFNIQGQLVIVFDIQSVSLAYYIKEYIGYGNVRKVKGKNAYLYIISCSKGLLKVLNLINGKLRNKNKYYQIDKIISNNKSIKINKVFHLNYTNDLENHWLAGFSDADASFQIKLINRNFKTEVRLNYQIDQKEDYILILIKNYFGGNIRFRSSQSTYYYGSTSFGSAKNVINYFNSFHMLSVKHVNYLKWRKAYILVQTKNQISKEGLNKIIKLKSSMNKFNKTTI